MLEKCTFNSFNIKRRKNVNLKINLHISQKSNTLKEMTLMKIKAEINEADFITKISRKNKFKN